MISGILSHELWATKHVRSGVLPDQQIHHLGISEKSQGLRSILEGSTYTLCVCPMFPGGGSEDFGEIVSALRARWP